MGLFNMFNKKKIVEVTIHLNARLQPIHRGDFEDMLESVLKKNKAGEVVGGGTLLLPTKEIASCDVECDIYEDQLDKFIHFLHHVDMIPKGSHVSYNDTKIEIGFSEGLAIYLNGTDLPGEVYKNNDINELLEQLDNVLDKTGIRLSHWEGPTETALYYYGKDYNEMKDKVVSITQTHPLCEKCRIEKIA